MNEVPEGQVPRDRKFWNTYWAVQREENEALTAINCEREGHNIHWTVIDSEGHCKCGKSREEVHEWRKERNWIIRKKI